MFKSKVILVRACSERFLSDLESRWQESVRLTGITDIIRTHAKENFQVYVKYCSIPGLPGPHLEAAQAGGPTVRRSLKGVGEQLRVPVAGHALLPHAAHAEDHQAAFAHRRNPPKAAQTISRAACLC